MDACEFAMLFATVARWNPEIFELFCRLQRDKSAEHGTLELRWIATLNSGVVGVSLILAERGAGVVVRS